MEKKLIKKIGIYLTRIELLVLVGVVAIWCRFIPKSIYESMEERLSLEKRIFYETQNTELMDKECIPYNLVGHISTLKNESMFAVNASTGEVLAESPENQAWLELDGIGDRDDIIKAIQKADDGRVVWLQRKPVFMKTKVIYDDIMLVDLYWPIVRLEAAVIMALSTILMTIVIMVASMVLVRHYFREYIFEDMEKIEDGIKRIISGDPDVVFDTEHDTEMKNITRVLNAWNRNVQSTARRLDWVVTATNTDSAMFQCLAYTTQLHHSDNLQRLLGLSDEAWKPLQKNTMEFMKYINALLEDENEEGLIEVNGKYLQIRITDMDGDSFGVVTDRTEELETHWELEKVHEMAIRDSLTGMLNRKGFEQYLRVLLSEKNSDTVVMLMFDVDNFKKLNDTKGHPEGDRLLKQISRQIKQSFRKSDMVARLGGDEFALLFNTPIPWEVLEKKLQNLLKEVRESLKEYDCQLSLSIGAVYMKAESVSYDELYRRTDKALYEAKKAGKNTYVMHSYE